MAERVDPIRSLKSLIGKKVFVKLRTGGEVRGKMHAYDEHLNMVLGDMVEKNLEANGSTTERKLQMSYMRGDSITMVTRIE